MELDVLIIGAGPAGLGAAERLARSGCSWAVLEASNRIGGLSSSRRDASGFTWDLGGHVLFSKEPVFKKAVDAAMGQDAPEHERASYVRIYNRWVPYPLQENIGLLPKAAMMDCLAGMEAAAVADGGNADNFKKWIEQKLGSGLARRFMLPYNRKVWSHDLEQMGYGWIDGRVSLPNLKEVKRRIKSGEPYHGWGANSCFRFPLSGGTGGLFKQMAKPHMQRIELMQEVISINPQKRTAKLCSGKVVMYKKLISSMPLDVLCKSVLPSPEVVKDAAGQLVKNSGWMVGVGLKKRFRSSKCWAYFPSEAIPFYRVTWFSNYSPKNVPSGGFSSLLCEISLPHGKKMSRQEAVSSSVAGLIKGGVLRKEDEGKIVSLWAERLPYSYPVPTLGRDAALKVIEPYLQKLGISSVGRFGGWRYERGNMDHSFMSGYKAADRFLK